MCQVAAVVAAYLAVVQGEAPTVRFQAEPRVIGRGDSAVLSWQVTSGATVFLSPFGDVPASSRRTIRPAETLTYTLVAERAGGVTSAQLTVVVSGGKGESEFPDRSAFVSPFSYRAPSPSSPALLARVHDILQNELHYSVRTHEEPGGTIVFETNRLIRGDLVSAAETRIARRRLAFRVAIAARATRTSPFSVAIETLIEYQRAVERVWRPDTDDALHEAQARRLAQLIGTGP